MISYYKFKSIFLFLLLFLNHPLLSKQQDIILLYAPISLSEAIKDVLSIYHANNDIRVKPVFMGTSQLVLQIKNGAKPDIFISANESWMDYLEGKSLILKTYRKNFLYNSLVLITSKNNKIGKLENVNELKELLYKSKTKISLAMTKSIPAGIYAKSYFKNIKIWSKLDNKFVESVNVRAALNFVARGDLEFGIVYRSDALVSNKIKIVYSLEKEKHKKIIYPMAILNNKVKTMHLYNFLFSKSSLLIMKKWGFEIKND